MGIVVTGHRGFIGSYLTRNLDDYVGLDKVEGNDILNCDLPPADVVVHLAAQPGVIASMDDPWQTYLNNVMGTVRLVERCKDAKFIFASTGGAIQEEAAESPYGLSKLACEQFIKLRHPNYVILRFSNIYGKGSRSVIDKFLNEDEITIYGDGSATRTYCHVDDLVRGIIQSLDWPKGEYYFGSGQTYTVKQLAEATGKPIKYESWRPGEIRYSSLVNTAIDWTPTIDALDYIKANV